MGEPAARTAASNAGERTGGEEARERVRRVELALEAVESLPEASREVTFDAFRELLALYGDALRRVLERLGGTSERVDPVSLAEDELIGHLLMVHGLHPLGFEDPSEVPGAPGGPPLVQLGTARPGPNRPSP